MDTAGRNDSGNDVDKSYFTALAALVFLHRCNRDGRGRVRLL
jgi:hypothetical protein